MRQLVKYLFLLYIIFYPLNAFSHNENKLEAPISQNAVIVATDQGIKPNTIHFKRKDGVLFFLNNTKESLLTLKINFGKRKLHCTSKVMALTEDGYLSSKEPISPKNFISTCFPELGPYDFYIYGIPKMPTGLKGTIFVE